MKKYGFCAASFAVIMFSTQVPAMAGSSTELSAMEELGQLIFFDASLSQNANEACAACHDPAAGFTGPNTMINAHGAVYEGSIAGRFGNRKPPSSAYATPSPILDYELEGPGKHMEVVFVGGNFWDGRATGEKLGNPAADQAQGPFLNPLEQALSSPADVVSRICAGSYGALFRSVWGDDACDAGQVMAAYDDVALSIEAFEASPASNAFTSKYDFLLRGMAKLTPQEKEGLAMFKGKAKCTNCHVIDTAPGSPGPLFTDFTFDNLGVPRNPENPFYEEPMFNPAGYDYVDTGLGGFLQGRMDWQEYATDNLGKQKVPTLRNVDKRPSEGFVKAYGHNGYFKSLKGIVNFYNTRDVKPRCPDPFTTEADALQQGCWPEPEVGVNVNHEELGNLHLTDDQEDALVAFMKTLSDGYQP
jgi:cytochrome c peroxidase